jgi:hypothetical protein
LLTQLSPGDYVFQLAPRQKLKFGHFELAVRLGKLYGYQGLLSSGLLQQYLFYRGHFAQQLWSLLRKKLDQGFRGYENRAVKVLIFALLSVADKHLS